MIAAIRCIQTASDMLDEAFAALMGVNRTDGRCLDIVQRLGRITAGALAQRSGLTTGAVATVIDRMEKAGYLRRCRDRADRRKVHVKLTGLAGDLGRVVYTQIPAAGLERSKSLPPKDMHLITGFLRTRYWINEKMTGLMRQDLEPGASPHLQARGVPNGRPLSACRSAPN